MCMVISTPMDCRHTSAMSMAIRTGAGSVDGQECAQDS